VKTKGELTLQTNLSDLGALIWLGVCRSDHIALVFASCNRHEGCDLAMSTTAAADWTNLPKEHTLSKFAGELEDIIKDADYNEMYGVHLDPPSEGYTHRHHSLAIAS